MQFKGELQYRAKALSGIVTQIFWGIMYICLYSAFMKNGTVNGFSLDQMTTYVWLGQAFLVMRFVTLGKNTAEEIITGNVCYKFVRPIKLYNFWFAEIVGEKLASTILRFFPILLLAFFLPTGFKMTLPVSFVAFLLFLLSLIIGFLISVSLSMIAVNVVFKTLSGKGAVSIVTTICGLLGGTYVPLPLLPTSIQNIINYLPFRFISDLPFRIYIGNISITQSLIYIAISVGWLVVLIILGNLLMKKSLKKTIIQGG